MNRYHRQHLVVQLFHSRRYQDLWELVENPKWRLAKLKELGSDTSFLDDLRFALMSVEQQQVAGLPRLFQYSLLDTLLRALAASTPTSRAKSVGNQDAIQSDLKRAETILEPRRRVEAFLSVTRRALDSCRPEIARQAVKQAETAVELVDGIHAQIKLLVDIAGAKADTGQPDLAKLLLQRAVRLLQGIFDERRKDAEELSKHSGSQPRSLHSPPSIKSQSLPIIPSSKSSFGVNSIIKAPKPIPNPLSGVGVGEIVHEVGIFAIMASTWAKLGQRGLAQGILASLKPIVHKMTETELNLKPIYLPIRGLVEAIRQLVGLGDLDLATQALDTLRPTYGETARRLLPELAQEVSQMGHTRFALQIIGKIQAPPLSYTTTTASLQDELIAKLVTGVQDRDSLQAIAEASPGTNERCALTAVVLRYVQLGSINEAIKIAQKDGPVVQAYLAAHLIAQGNSIGQATLDQILNAARSQRRSHLKFTQFSQITRALVEAGSIQRALVVWEEAQKISAEEKYEPTLFITDQDAVDNIHKETLKTVSVIAAGLAQAGQRQQALNLVESLKPVPDRVKALTAIATSLACIGSVTESRQIFEVAYTTARSTLSPENRANSLKALFDGLLAAQEFEWAFQVARSIDRIYTLESYTSEPGLVFKKAKDWLARAMGLPEDEELAREIVPNFQVKVINEIAMAGDYNLARQLATQIKNISVQDDMKSVIALAAARARDDVAAYAMADEVIGTRDRKHIMEMLAAEAAQTGVLSRAFLVEKNYHIESALAHTALAAGLAAQGRSNDAKPLIERVVQNVADHAGEESDQVYMLGKLIRLAGRIGYDDGVTFILKRAIALIPRNDSPYDLADDLAEIGWADETLKLLRRWPYWCPEDDGAYLYRKAGLSLARQGKFVAALAIADQLTGSDKIRECVALKLAQTGQFTEARRTAQSITEKQISDETHRTIATLETITREHQAARPIVEHLLKEPDKLDHLSRDIITALVFRLVFFGHYPLARKLVKAIPKDTLWPPGSKREQVTLALVQAATQRHIGVPGQEIVEIVETELSEINKIYGLRQIAAWTINELPQTQERAFEPVFQSIQTARNQGHDEVLMHLAGLVPLLDGLGGIKLIQETIGRLQQIEENWC